MFVVNERTASALRNLGWVDDRDMVVSPPLPVPVTQKCGCRSYPDTDYRGLPFVRHYRCDGHQELAAVTWPTRPVLV